MSLRGRGIPDRLAKGVDLVAILLARVLIDDGNGRCNDEARRVTDCRSRASRCLENFFAEAYPRFRQGLAGRQDSTNDACELRVFGEFAVMERVGRAEPGRVDNLYSFALEFWFFVRIDGA